MTERSISAAEADLMIGRSWFTDHTTTVTVFDAPVSMESFDAELRAAAAGGAEMALFVHGLRVSGTMRMGADTPSVYVVLGELRVGRLELGDAMLAASGPVIAEQYVHLPRTRGVFAVGADATTDDATTPALPPVSAPIVVWHDVRRGIDRVFSRGEKGLRVVAADAWPEALKALWDPKSETFTDANAVLAALQSGITIQTV